MSGIGSNCSPGNLAHNGISTRARIASGRHAYALGGYRRPAAKHITERAHVLLTPLEDHAARNTTTKLKLQSLIPRSHNAISPLRLEAGFDGSDSAMSTSAETSFRTARGTVAILDRTGLSGASRNLYVRCKDISSMYRI
jgi:hypothetical protein